MGGSSQYSTFSTSLEFDVSRQFCFEGEHMFKELYQINDQNPNNQSGPNTNTNTTFNYQFGTDMPNQDFSKVLL